MDATVSGLTIRSARPSDAEQLVAFAKAMADETEDRQLDTDTLRAGMAALLADPSRGRVLVVESAGTVAATLMLTVEWSEWRNGFFWWIQSVYVRPEFRRQLHDVLVQPAAESLAAGDDGGRWRPGAPSRLSRSVRLCGDGGTASDMATP